MSANWYELSCWQEVRFGRGGMVREYNHGLRQPKIDYAEIEQKTLPFITLPLWDLLVESPFMTDVDRYQIVILLGILDDLAGADSRFHLVLRDIGVRDFLLGQMESERYWQIKYLLESCLTVFATEQSKASHAFLEYLQGIAWCALGKDIDLELVLNTQGLKPGAVKNLLAQTAQTLLGQLEEALDIKVLCLTSHGSNLQVLRINLQQLVVDIVLRADDDVKDRRAQISTTREAERLGCRFTRRGITRILIDKWAVAAMLSPDSIDPRLYEKAPSAVVVGHAKTIQRAAQNADRLPLVLEQVRAVTAQTGESVLTGNDLDHDYHAAADLLLAADCQALNTYQQEQATAELMPNLDVVTELALNFLIAFLHQPSKLINTLLAVPNFATRFTYLNQEVLRTNKALVQSLDQRVNEMTSFEDLLSFLFAQKIIKPELLSLVRTYLLALPNKDNFIQKCTKIFQREAKSRFLWHVQSIETFMMLVLLFKVDIEPEVDIKPGLTQTLIG